jgi:hypothetical protein
MAKPAKKKKANKAKHPVHVGLDRLQKLTNAVAKAGVEKDFEKVLSKNKTAVVVQIDRDKFHELKGLIEKHGLSHLDDCDCKHGDPFCICM